MSKLKELELRLRDEPDNLGLRVMLAGALHDAGRRADAVDLYRSVALAYRDQGRTQQAIAVCRSILELAPNDAMCQELLATLLASVEAPRGSSPLPGPPGEAVGLAPRSSPPAGPAPRSRPPGRRTEAVTSAGAVPTDAVDVVHRPSSEATPLPLPLAYHDADPTTGLQRQVTRFDLPPSLADELASCPDIAGIAAAARQISASLIAASRGPGDPDPPDRDDDLARANEPEALDELVDELAADLDTGRLLRTGAPGARSTAPLLAPATPVLETPACETPAFEIPAFETSAAAPAEAAASDEDEPTLPPPEAGVVRAGLDDDATQPRELPSRTRRSSIAPPSVASGALSGAFFAPLPPRSRVAVLQRFRRQRVAAGATVIDRGQAGHGLAVVVHGRLDVLGERRDAPAVPRLAIGPGEFIGEASLLVRGPAPAQVVAGLDSELLVLAAEDFHDVLSVFPSLRAALARIADDRARLHPPSRPR